MRRGGAAPGVPAGGRRLAWYVGLTKQRDPGTAAADAQPESQPAIATWHRPMARHPRAHWLGLSPGQPDQRSLRVFADGRADGVELQTQPSPNEVINTWSTDADVDPPGFTRLDWQGPDRRLPEVSQSWLVTGSSTSQGRLRFNRRFGSGSAGHLSADIGGCFDPCGAGDRADLVVARRVITAVATELAGSVATVDVVALVTSDRTGPLESEGGVCESNCCRPARRLPDSIDIDQLLRQLSQCPANAESPARRGTSPCCPRTADRQCTGPASSRGRDLSFPANQTTHYAMRRAVYAHRLSMCAAVLDSVETARSFTDGDGRWYGSRPHRRN